MYQKLMIIFNVNTRLNGDGLDTKFNSNAEPITGKSCDNISSLSMKVRNVPYLTLVHPVQFCTSCNTVPPFISVLRQLDCLAPWQIYTLKIFLDGSRPVLLPSSFTPSLWYQLHCLVCSSVSVHTGHVSLAPQPLSLAPQPSSSSFSCPISANTIFSWMEEMLDF